MTSPDQLVSEYLRELKAKLAGLPADRRAEILEEVADHIDEARSTTGARTEVDLRNILERLGSPAAIAAEARERFGIQSYRPGARETWTLVLLAIGGIVIPILGWIIGAVLLWGSKAWSKGEKLIGTLAVPGGLALPFFMVFYGLGATSTLYEEALVAAAVLAIAGITYLTVRMRERAKALSA